MPGRLVDPVATARTVSRRPRSALVGVYVVPCATAFDPRYQVSRTAEALRQRPRVERAVRPGRGVPTILGAVSGAATRTTASASTTPAPHWADEHPPARRAVALRTRSTTTGWEMPTEWASAAVAETAGAAMPVPDISAPAWAEGPRAPVLVVDGPAAPGC